MFHGYILRMSEAAIVLGCATHAFGQSVLTAPVGEFQNYALDSGAFDNAGDRARSVWREVVHVEGAAWLRLYFQEVHLPPGSTLVITSQSDKAMQHHTASTLLDWSNTSAYFNGDSVELELYAGPHTTGNRVILDRVAFQRDVGSVAGGGQPCGVCADDDREISDEHWVGRLMPIGCTASMFSPEGCFVTAGHCIGAALVMQFQVPLSSPNGVPQNPGPEDQYPVIQSSVQGENCCPGLDWGFFQCGPNTETGMFAIDVQGEYRPIATVLPEEFPTVIEITGYGVSLIGPLSQAQKKSSGPLTDFMPYPGFDNPSWFHLVDTTGGNSGSSIIHDGRIIGIVTHCQVGCPNLGMPVNYPNFVSAWSTCPSAGGDCEGDLDIDVDDFAHFPSCLTGPVAMTSEPNCACADLSPDTHVDLVDMAAMQNQFTGNLCIDPVPIAPPQSQTVCRGSPVALSASFESIHPLMYQWYRGANAITGATSATLTLPSFQPGDVGSYSVRVSSICGETQSAAALLSLCSGSLFEDNFESNMGWAVVSDPNMIRGQWFRLAPVQTMIGNTIVQPGMDDPLGTGTKCFATGPFGGQADSNDVDGGPTVLYSPMFDFAGHETLTLRYAYWFFRDNQAGEDALVVSVSSNGGANWVDVTRHTTTTHEWSLYARSISDLVTPSATMQLRFSIQDNGGETLLEALIDDLEIVTAD